MATKPLYRNNAKTKKQKWDNNIIYKHKALIYSIYNVDAIRNLPIAVGDQCF